MGDAEVDDLAQDGERAVAVGRRTHDPRTGQLHRAVAEPGDGQIAQAQQKVEYDAFLAACPSRALLDRISDKWVALVLAALGSDGSHRFGADCAGEPRSMRYSELARLLVGVSQKMLTQTLRSLERDGLVTRTATATVPVTVSYELTDLGLSLHRMMRGLKTWAEAHMDDVLAHRADYDTRRTVAEGAPTR